MYRCTIEFIDIQVERFEIKMTVFERKGNKLFPRIFVGK